MSETLRCTTCGSLNISQEILENTAQRMKRIIECYECKRHGRACITIQIINHPINKGASSWQ